MPRFVEPQLCKLVERPTSEPGWAHEVKFDGYRMQLRVEDGHAQLRTRKGIDWTGKFPAIAEAAGALPDCLLDGEVVALDKHGAPDFAALQAALSDRKTDELIFFAFDLLFIDGEDLRELPLRDRKARLKALLAKAKLPPVLRYVEHFETAGDAVLRSACTMHLEGIVSKRLDAPYRSGRGDDWTKAKCRGGHEVVIGGWTSEGGQLRSLLVGVHRGRKLVYVGRVGTGFAAETVRRLLPRLKEVESKTSPFAAGASPPKEAEHALGAARAGGRDRVRRLDRRRHGAPGRLQGPARGQARRRGRGGEARQGGQGQGLPGPSREPLRAWRW